MQPDVATQADPSQQAGAAYRLSPAGEPFGHVERLSYRADIERVCYLMIFYGQSENIGQKSAAEPLIAARPVYPGKALMFEDGPWVGPSTGQVGNLVERERGTIPGGQGETKASSAVNHLLRDFHAMTGAMPFAFAIVGGQGGATLSMLEHGSPAMEDTLAAVRAACRWARSKGLQPVVLAFDREQGQSDEIDQGPSQYRDAKGDAPRRIAELRRFARVMTERLLQISGQREMPLILLH